MSEEYPELIFKKWLDENLYSLRIDAFYYAWDYQQEKIDKLEQDLKDAYRDGFEDGVDHNNIAYKYPDLALSYLMSETRKKVKAMTDEEKKLILKWLKENYNNKPQIDLDYNEL